MFIISCVVQCLLLISVPIAVGFWFRQRWGLSWHLFLGGALAYVLALMVTNLILLPGEIGLMFSAIAQMGALYLVYRFQLKTARTERAALMAGVSQAGVEIMLMGVFAALSLLQMSSLRNATDEHLIDLAAKAYDVAEEEIAATQVDEMRASIDDVWSAPWYGPLIQPIQSFEEIVLPLRNATEEELVSWAARKNDVTEDEIEPAMIDNMRTFIDSFWNTAWYGLLIQPLQALSFLPVQAVLGVIVLRALTRDHWRPLVGAMGLHFLSRLLPLYGQLLGGLIVWLVISLLAGGMALWFLYRLRPVLQDQTSHI